MSKEDRKRQLREWFDPDSDNFLGTGLTLAEAMLWNAVNRFRWWFGRHGREEKNKRLHFIMELSAELQRIKATGYMYGTRLAEAPIECIIEGDLDGLKMWAHQWSKQNADMCHPQLPDDDPQQPWRVYETFQRLCEEASLTLTKEPSTDRTN